MNYTTEDSIKCESSPESPEETRLYMYGTYVRVHTRGEPRERSHTVDTTSDNRTGTKNGEFTW